MQGNQSAGTPDYGPLAHLIGAWKGDKGLDRSPEPDGSEENRYYETLVYTAVGDVSNAGSQTLAVIRYQQVVQRKSDDSVFHDETGYWMWDADNGLVMHALSIPRAVCVLAGGHWTPADNAGKEFSVAVCAKLDDPDWGIIQSPFMRDHATTREFRQTLRVESDKLNYSQTTVLDIYGKQFEHTDQNALIRC